MANILQVQNPGLNSQGIGSPGVYPHTPPGPQIQGPDRPLPPFPGESGEQQIGPEVGGGNVNFESNYTNFVQRMHELFQY